MLDSRLTEVTTVTGRFDPGQTRTLRDIRAGPAGNGVWTEGAPVRKSIMYLENEWPSKGMLRAR